jgi:predicted transcriptional regulator
MGKVKISIALDEDVLEWIDEIAENLRMSRSEFINMVLSGGRDARKLVDEIIDKWFDRKKSEIKSRLGFQPVIARKEER